MPFGKTDVRRDKVKLKKKKKRVLFKFILV